MSVLVYTENWDGVFKKLSFELVSYAAKVAEMMGTSVTAVSIGDVADDELAKLGNYGAIKVVKVDGNTTLDNQVYTGIIAQVAEAEGAKVVVLSHNNTGKALAPRLSVKLKAAVGAGLIALPSSTEPFTVTVISKLCPCQFSLAQAPKISSFFSLLHFSLYNLCAAQK